MTSRFSKDQGPAASERRRLFIWKEIRFSPFRNAFPEEPEAKSPVNTESKVGNLSGAATKMR
jgi:hypothetical protein